MKFPTTAAAEMRILVAAGLMMAMLVFPGTRGAAEEADQPRIHLRTNPKIECPTREAMARLYSKPLAQVDIVAPVSKGPMPLDCSEGLFAGPGCRPRVRPWACTQFQWVAPEMVHQPLYFDETPLERYGQSPCPLLQPAISAAHFFAMFPLMPYKLGLDGPYERVYTLGYYRPDSADTPCVRQRLPWDTHAALMEAGAWTGGAILLP